jgi:hypothetical protein
MKTCACHGIELYHEYRAANLLKTHRKLRTTPTAKTVDQKTALPVSNQMSDGDQAS